MYESTHVESVVSGLASRFRSEDVAMSRGANHRYLLGYWLHASVHPFTRPRAFSWKLLAIWLALIVVFTLTYDVMTGDYAWAPDPRVTLFVVVVGLLSSCVLYYRWARADSVADSVSDYWTDLQHPGPDRLVERVTQQLKSAQELPDFDAFMAQALALSHALYGRGDDANRALAAIEWSGRAPLIQGVGLVGEGLVELLCRRDAERARLLFCQAGALTSMSLSVPGAADGERHIGALVAVSDVALGRESPTSATRLADCAEDDRFPPMKLIATFGLAVVATRSGDRARAAELRGFLTRVAPHCTPLHREPDALVAADREPPSPAAPGPVSSALQPRSPLQNAR